MSELVNIYFWIAAMGFPILLPWALMADKDMKTNYKLGYHHGWIDGAKESPDEAIE